MSVNFTREGRQYPFSIPEGKDTHSAWKAKGIGYKTKRVFQNHLTGNNYEDSLVFDMRLYKNIVIHIMEIGKTNAIKYKVLACLDPETWYVLKSDTPVSAGSSAYETLTDAWNYIKIQVASNVVDNPGKINAFIGAKSA